MTADLCASVPVVYPRVGGGNVCALSHSITESGLSPRGRGKPIAPTPTGQICRSIPAWAGETANVRGTLEKVRVYPRVGGGNPKHMPSAITPKGLSPRGRGKQYRIRSHSGIGGSIPAWAGETSVLA